MPTRPIMAIYVYKGIFLIPDVALQYLIYLLALPPQRLAHRALQDLIALNEAGRPGWVMDLRYVVGSLPLGGDITLPHFEGLQVSDVGDVLKKIMGLMTIHMQSLIDNSPKLYDVSASRQAGT